MTQLDPQLYLLEFERFLGSVHGREQWGDCYCCAADPDQVNGSSEDLVEGGVKKGAKIAGGWGSLVLDHLEGATTSAGILEALSKASDAIDLDGFADQVHERLVHGALIGAADSLYERESGREVEIVKFAEEQTIGSSPFQKAIDLFLKRKIMPKPAFDALDGEAKRRAFTVAGMARDELIGTVHAELLRQFQGAPDPYAGPDLREFKKFAKERLESAGWTPSNSTHVENIFRTNVATAYSSGRRAEQTQPSVLAALPYWQIRGVNDSRARAKHKAAFNIVLPANHEFWRRAYPPFGFMCRCRVISRSYRWIQANNITIGPVPQGLPDPGFDGGTGALLLVPSAAFNAPAPSNTPEGLYPPPPRLIRSQPVPEPIYPPRR